MKYASGKFRSGQQMDKEIADIEKKINEKQLDIKDHFIIFDKTNGYDQEIRWMSGALIMANIEIAQGGKWTTFRVHEFSFDPTEKRTMKKNRMVTQSFNEAFSAVKELLS